MQNYTPAFVNVFVNPGEYHLNLKVNINVASTGVHYNYPQIGMPQQQVPAVEYGPGHARQFGNGYVPFNNNAFCFPRPDSNSSLLDESSYSSELSTPGIASNSWSFASPHQIYPHNMNPGGQRLHNNAHLHESQRLPHTFSTGDSMNRGFNPTMKSAEFIGTPSPTKGGCFSAKNCAII